MKRLNEIVILPEHKILKDRKSGKQMEFVLRCFKKGDEAGMVRCVRDEYGDSYFKTFFYDTDKIVEYAAGDDYDFFVAEADDRIAGMEIFTYFMSEGECYIEPASQILGRDFRGYGLSKELVDYTFRILEQLKPAAIFVHAVTFHSFTQHTCEKKDMVPVGFRLGSFLTERMENSYVKGRCDKYSEGILIKAVGKKDAGTIYLPEELIEFGHKIYRRLGVRYRIETIPCKWEDRRVEKGVYLLGIDEAQQFVKVQIRESGKDLKSRMEELIQRYRGKGKWSIQISIYSDVPYVKEEYEQLKKLGFFFTGLKPLCGEREQFYMRWVDDWNLCMEDYVLTDQFAELCEDIERFYEKRRIQ